MPRKPNPLAEAIGAGALGGRDGPGRLGVDRRRFDRVWENVRRPLPWSVVAVPAMLFDVLTVAVTTSLAGDLYDRDIPGQAGSWNAHLGLAILISIVFGIISIAKGRYRASALLRQPERHGVLAVTLLASFACVAVFLLLTQTSLPYSHGMMILSFAASFAALSLLRRLTVRLFAGFNIEGVLRSERVLVVGPADQLDLASSLMSRRPLLQVIGRAALPTGRGGVMPKAELDALALIARRANPDAIVILPSAAPRDLVLGVVSKLMEFPAAIILGTDPALASLAGPARADTDAPLGTVIVGPPLTRGEQAVKRSFDVLASAAALALLAPVLVAIALVVTIESGGPVFFRQTRYGYNRRPFRVWKFRTLWGDASSEPFRQVTSRDDRVTAVGRLLRRTNLDELPQLLNVLGGSMSLVGPRPHPVELDDRFDPLIAHYARRYKIRPGITGWAQVNGFRGETNTIDKMEQRISHDIYYVSNWSLPFDIKILLLTLLSGRSYRNAR